MNILFLGPECLRIEDHLALEGHSVTRCEGPFERTFLDKNGFDFCISYRYKSIIKYQELSWFNGKIINLHISYLPYNRGYDPNFWSFFDDTPSGVSIHILEEGIDSGDILLQKEIVFDKDKETLRTTYDELSKEIESLFIENSKQIFNQQIRTYSQVGSGTFHLSTDKNKFLSVLKKKSWDTPVIKIYQAGKVFRACNEDMFDDKCS